MNLPSTTQMLISRLGSFPSAKSSPISMVKFRKEKTSFIMATKIKAVLLVGDNPDSISSFSQALVQHRCPPVHLQPIFKALRKVLMSSIYRFPLRSFMLFFIHISIHLASHSFIITLATAHVLLKPIGPPAFWRKDPPFQEYT